MNTAPVNDRLAGVLSRQSEVMAMNAEIQRAYREAKHTKKREAGKATLARFKARHPDKWLTMQREVSARRRENAEASRSGDAGLVEAADRLVREWMAAESFVCVYCRQEAGEGQRTVDHVIPVSAGGKHEPGNIARACRRCNSRKHTRGEYYA